MKYSANAVLSVMTGGALVTTDQRDTYINKLERETSNLMRNLPVFEAADLSKEEVFKKDYKDKLDELVRRCPELGAIREEAVLAGLVLRKKIAKGEMFDESYRAVCGMLQIAQHKACRKSAFEIEFNNAVKE